MDQRVFVVSTGLDEEDLDFGVGRQPICKNTASGPGTNDDIIESNGAAPV